MNFLSPNEHIFNALITSSFDFSAIDITIYLSDKTVISIVLSSAINWLICDV